MSVIDLRERLSAAGRSAFIPTPRAGGDPKGEPSKASGSVPVADLLLNPVRMTTGWPIAALDLLSGVLAVALAAVATGELALSILVLAFWPLALLSTRQYGNAARRGQVRRAAPIVAAWTRTAAGLALATIAVPSLPVSDAMVALTAIGAITLINRYLAGRIASTPRSKELALVKGPLDQVQRLVELLDRDKHAPFEVRVIQTCEGVPSGDWVDSKVLVPSDSDTVDAAVRNHVQHVLVVGSLRDDPDEVRRAVWRLEGHGISTAIIPLVTDISGPEISTLGSTGIPIIQFHSRDVGAEVGIIKVILDKVLATIALVLLAPALALAALAVHRSSPGPVLFRQVRVGRSGQPFHMLKFRTMYVDAEARRAELEHLNEHDGATLFKMRDDPRITRIGKVLRKYSIDELPQLLNVVRGEMSLVGPRPPLPQEVANYDVDRHRRFRVRPGLTGLWQVSGRSELDPEQSARLDNHYVEQWSPMMDVNILLRTPSVVISGRGAY